MKVNTSLCSRNPEKHWRSSRTIDMSWSTEIDDGSRVTFVGTELLYVGDRGGIREIPVR